MGMSKFCWSVSTTRCGPPPGRVERGVDLLLPEPGHVDRQVARERDEEPRLLLGIDVDDHERVRALSAFARRVPEGRPLLGRLHLGAGVGPDEEEVGRLAGVGVLRGLDLHAGDLVDLAVDERVHAHHAAQDERDGHRQRHCEAPEQDARERACHRRGHATGADADSSVARKTRSDASRRRYPARVTPAGAQMTAGAPPSAAALLAALPPTLDAAVVRDGQRFVVAAAPDAVRVASGPDALDVLDRLPPGWWAGFLSYELGGAVERVTPRRRPDGGTTPSRRSPTSSWPASRLAWCSTRRRAGPSCTGSGEARRRVGAGRRSGARRCRPCPLRPRSRAGSRASTAPSSRQRVATILEHIARRRLLPGEPHPPARRANSPPTRWRLFAALERCNPSPHGALLRFGGAPGTPTVAVVSASPERFLSWRGRDAETRPIKGTGTDPTALAASAKDRAENVMIVDLARNDLGRVCEPGSIVVPALCALEAHPGLAPSREHRARTAARRHRDRRAGAGDVPAGVGHRRAQAARAADHRGPRAGAAGRLLRRGRLDRHRARRGRPRRRDPHVHGRGRTHAPRRRRRASSPTRIRPRSGPRPSSRPRACSPRPAPASPTHARWR